MGITFATTKGRQREQLPEPSEHRLRLVLGEDKVKPEYCSARVAEPQVCMSGLMSHNAWNGCHRHLEMSLGPIGHASITFRVSLGCLNDSAGQSYCLRARCFIQLYTLAYLAFAGPNVRRHVSACSRRPVSSRSQRPMQPPALRCALPNHCLNPGALCSGRKCRRSRTEHYYSAILLTNNRVSQAGTERTLKPLPALEPSSTDSPGMHVDTNS